MVRVVVSSACNSEAIVACITQFRPSILYVLNLLAEGKLGAVSSYLGAVEKAFKNVVEVRHVSFEAKDVVCVAEEFVKLVDGFPKNFQVILNLDKCVSCEVALGLMFGAYARHDRISRICFYLSGEKKLLMLPKCQYYLTKSERRFLEEIGKQPLRSCVNLHGIYKKIGLSKAIVYKNINRLKQEGFIAEGDNGVYLTEYGKVALL